MKTQQKKELKVKTADELIKELRDLRAGISKLSIDTETGKSTDTNMLKKTRKDIARVLTYLSQKPKEATS